MNYKLLVEMAVLSGEILLSSGAEAYRVEDTMSHILQISGLKKTEVFVIATGFVITLDDVSIEEITVVKRIKNRDTDLNRVYLVNDISRRLCNGMISLEDAYEELCEKSSKKQFSVLMKHIGTVGTAAFFTIILGGTMIDVLFAALSGTILTATLRFSDYIGINSFCKNALGSIAIAFFIMTMGKLTMDVFQRDIVIIGTIMPIVPGVLFTTAIRDTLYGDYLSGCSRIVEAIIVALGIATGVGAGIALFQYFL